MTTRVSGGKTVVRLLFGLAVLLTLSSVALAQPTGTVTRLVLKSDVLETKKLSYPVLYMTDGDSHMTHTASTIEFLTQNNDANAAIYKANYERVHAKLKETTKKQ